MCIQAPHFLSVRRGALSAGSTTRLGVLDDMIGSLGQGGCDGTHAYSATDPRMQSTPKRIGHPRLVRNILEDAVGIRCAREITMCQRPACC
jgi:hypothetical protein